MIRNQRGFTLVELLVTLALTGIIMVGVYKTFTWQQKVHEVQESVTTMQQDCRIGMEVMLKDLRMAGYSPKTAGVASIVSATDTSIRFLIDKDGNGVCETTIDTNGNGVIEQCEDISYSISGNSLMRNDTVNNVALIDNVDGLKFIYLNSAGNPLGTPVSATDLSNIRKIQITMVVRSNQPDREYRNNATYKDQLNNTIVLNTPDTRYRRRVLTATVRCRNLGI